MTQNIIVAGARQHNLKGITVEIPKKKLVVITGVSGSGKSSLVFDTIYAEAQRQLIETFSSYARSRLPKLSRPDVDAIHNISPVIVIDQKRLGTNPRSTVGTATEIYTYLRLLFSRCGLPEIGDSNVFSFNNPAGMCPVCRGLGRELVFDVDSLVDWDKSLRQGAIRHRHFREGKWLWKVVMNCGLFDLDKPLNDYSDEERDLLLFSEKHRLSDHPGNQFYNIHFEGVVTGIKRRNLGREGSDRGAPAVEMQFFKFSSCPECNGSRLNERARSVRVNGKGIPELAAMELTELLAFLGSVTGRLADPIVNRMKELLHHLVDIGIGYISLNQPVMNLSGGESQRIKMARQLGCDLVDLIYILDEPTMGLHPKDISHLIAMLGRLRDQGNSVLVVEHDPAVIECADIVLDIGPGAGRQGGEVTFQGTVSQLRESDALTGQWLRNRRGPIAPRRKPAGAIPIRHARVNNLKDVSVDIPTGVFVCVTGVAGSGKSSLIHEVFAARHPEAIVVDQSAVLGSNRSNPATYTEVFGLIRQEFARATGKKPSLFSFNSDGACPRCKGQGQLKVEMHFLDAVTIVCEKCAGKRYIPEVLALHYRGKSICQVLETTVAEAYEFFDNPRIKGRLRSLLDVGLDYLELGQPLSTLSGGESQRTKLAAELQKKGNIYIMDEPTVGLHLADIDKLLQIIDRLVDSGNTVVTIEHNLDVVRHADWVIDLGPGGGKAGGEVVAVGTPENIACTPGSFTGEYLKALL
ncbi:MAG: excinuclease ABC subunit UvrA [Acidobacteria bacterium]|nr:MAG: excinuclease ABC subunit UvrA [Acidobacteriota bacterium]